MTHLPQLGCPNKLKRTGWGWMYKRLLMALHVLNRAVKRNKMHPLIGEVTERLHQRAICSKEPYCSMLTEPSRDRHNVNALWMYLKELFIIHHSSCHHLPAPHAILKLYIAVSWGLFWADIKPIGENSVIVYNYAQQIHICLLLWKHGLVIHV